MENFKAWILSLCGALVVSSIIRILLSNSSLNKTINIFLSMFIFLYSVIPLKNVFNDIDTQFNQENDQIMYEKYYRDGYEQIIHKAIGNVCESKGVKVISINIDSYIDDNGNYCVKNLEIEIELHEKNKIIKNELKNTLGFEVSVY